MFGWFRKGKARGGGKTGEPVRTLDEEIAALREAMRQTGMTEAAITRACDQLREEVEARARQQRLAENPQSQATRPEPSGRSSSQ